MTLANNPLQHRAGERFGVISSEACARRGCGEALNVTYARLY